MSLYRGAGAGPWPELLALAFPKVIFMPGCPGPCAARPARESSIEIEEVLVAMPTYL